MTAKKRGKTARGQKNLARRSGLASVSGQRDIIKELQKAGVRSETGVAIAVRDIAETIRQAASENAPRDTGFLSENIITEISGKGAETSALVGPNRDAFHGGFIEFGTSGGGVIKPSGDALMLFPGKFAPSANHRPISPQPFLRPAFDDNIDSAVSSAGRTVAKEMKL